MYIQAHFLHLFFKNCQMHGSMLSVVFKNFSMEFSVIWKLENIMSVIIIHMSAVFFDTIWYICLWLLCVGCSTFPPLTSKLYWLYSVPLVSILSSYLPHLPFSSPFLFTITASVPFLLVLVPFLPSMLRHHCLRLYQDGTFVLDFCRTFGLFAVSGYYFCTIFLYLLVFNTLT